MVSCLVGKHVQLLVDKALTVGVNRIASPRYFTLMPIQLHLRYNLCSTDRILPSRSSIKQLVFQSSVYIVPINRRSPVHPFKRLDARAQEERLECSKRVDRVQLSKLRSSMHPSSGRRRSVYSGMCKLERILLASRMHEDPAYSGLTCAVNFAEMASDS